MSNVPIFDGHNDLLARLYLAGGVQAAPTFFSGRPGGHIDADKAKAGGLIGGLFAVWAPGSIGARANMRQTMHQTAYQVPFPASVEQQAASAATQEQIATLRAIENAGGCVVCTSVTDIESAAARGALSAVMHLEGAEAIGADLVELDRLYEQGLRSLGPVWSRPTIFGSGVPFSFPADPDIGDGLTDAGVRLIKRCDALRIAIDLSHINEAGFWDVLRHSSGPLLATHSNAHSLCPHARNLTDRQLDAIRERDGLVGLNFATGMVRSDGRMSRDTPVSVLVDHLSYLIDRIGETRVALGSDFDGAVVPHAIGSAAGLPVLVEAMRERSFGEELIEQICSKNWLRVLGQIWGR